MSTLQQIMNPPTGWRCLEFTLRMQVKLSLLHMKFLFIDGKPILAQQ